MTLPDVDDLNTYGGALNDYAPVEDPSTDESAAFRNKYAANVAMMTQTICRAYARFVTAATTGGMSLAAHRALWGSLPAVAPTLARSGVGIYTVTWTATQNDLLSVSHTLNFIAAWGGTRTTTSADSMKAIPTAANVVTVYVRDAAGALTDTATTVDLFVV